jgi:hypothetical protein
MMRATTNVLLFVVGCELTSLCVKFVSEANILTHVFELAAFAN